MTDSPSHANVAAVDPIAPNTVVASKYRVLRKLGSGGMGVVVEVEHVEFPRRFALKWIRPDVVGSDAEVRFKQEAVVTGSLSHENLVSIVDFGRGADGSAFMVMELLAGDTLAAQIRRSGPMPIGRVVRIVEQVCAGLSAAHERGIVHRDIKPSNLFCTTRADGSELVKILDFGVAKALDASGAGVTATGSPVGTAHYMSPEQAGGGPVDARVDVYAVGVVAFEALTGGRFPHPGDTFAQVIAHLLTRPPLSLSELRPGLPPGLADVVAKAMAHEAVDRFASVRDLSRALRPFAATSASLDETAPRRDEGEMPVDGESVLSSGGGLGRTAHRVGRARASWLAPTVGAFIVVAAAASVSWQLRSVHRGTPLVPEVGEPTVPAAPSHSVAAAASSSVPTAAPPSSVEPVHEAARRPTAVVSVPSAPKAVSPAVASTAPTAPPVVTGRRGATFDTTNPY